MPPKQATLQNPVPTDEELVDVLKGILHAASNPDLEVLESFAYEGFDHRKTLTFLMKKELNREIFFREISILIQFVMIRGPNLEKARRTMSAPGSELIRGLYEKYGFQATPTSSKKDTPTLSRLIALFPRIVSNLMKNTEFYDKTAFSRIPDIEIETEHGSLKSNELPRDLRFPGSNAMLKSPMSPAYTAFMFSFSNVINRGKKSWEKLDKEERLSEVLKWQVVTSVNPLDRILVEGGKAGGASAEAEPAR